MIRKLNNLHLRAAHLNCRAENNISLSLNTVLLNNIAYVLHFTPESNGTDQEKPDSTLPVAYRSTIIYYKVGRTNLPPADRRIGVTRVGLSW